MSILNVDFAQLTADGSTVAYQAPASGKYAGYAYGGFGAGTLTFEASFDGTTYVAIQTGVTAAGRQSFDLVEGEYIRATISGSTTPTCDVSIR